MDRYIAQGAGFPGDNEFLMLIQSIIGEVSQLASLGGEDYILKGCVDTGGTVSDGWMVLNGEIVRFQGGAVGTNVTIFETVEQATYLEDINPPDGQGDVKDTYFTRTAQFGSGGAYTIPWANLERIEALLDVQKAKVPVGAIMMWAGAIGSIPDGWALCDGTNGTPDLSGRFIVGYDAVDNDYDSIGKTGGAKEVVLTENQMPSHNHSGSTNVAGTHTHTVPNDNTETPEHVDTSTDEWGSHTTPNQQIQTSAAGAHSHSFTTNSKGGNQPHENRPPYFTLAYIQYKG